MEDLALAEIIRLCVEGRAEKDAAWRELLRREHGLLRYVFGDRSGRGCGHEFLDWFPAWLVPKLEGFLLRLRSMYQQPEAVHLEEREGYVRSWLACVASRSAKPAFYKERRGKVKADRLADYEPENAVQDERFPQLKAKADEIMAAAARVVTRHHRIAFWLRYYLVCGELRSEDAAWVRKHCPDGDVLIRQRSAAAQENRHMWPFEAKDIARLMGVTHLANDGQDVVAQWIRRGLKEVKRVLKLAEGNDTEAESLDDQPA